VQEIQVGLKFNETHKQLFYADDVNLLGNNINTMKKTREALIDASAGVVCRCYFTRMQDKITIKRANRFFQNVAKFKYFGWAVVNQNLIHVGFKGGLDLHNACLTSFSSQSSVLLYAIKRYKESSIQNCNFSCNFRCAWNLISHIKGRKNMDWEEGSSTQKEGKKAEWKKIAQREVSKVLLLTTYC
jgi:hypothetical protein